MVIISWGSTNLDTELAVCGNDGDLADRDDENRADNTKEPKYIVVTALVLPQVLEHEQ